ncbi:VWA domain-containing protein [Amycolatopsis sp. NPDC051045]|uniref:vWA domain-containing protein n=1 Tax=Amycolatopsis sp. NPDC051045 TaxID=3156922 RepID=UPI00341D233F
MENEKGKLLPFYLVIDASWSMDGQKMATANKIMPRVQQAVADAPILSDKVRFSVIDFADDAKVLLPLCDVLENGILLPALTPRGATSYAAAFRLLRTQIEIDVKQLKADGYAVHRPAVFFISDGEPTDQENQWKSAFTDLTKYDKGTLAGFSMYPNFVPFGVDAADPRTLKELIHPTTGNKPMRMFLHEDGDPGAAIAAMAEVLISSVLASGESMAQGDSGIILPPDEDLPPGLASYTADDDFV